MNRVLGVDGGATANAPTMPTSAPAVTTNFVEAASDIPTQDAGEDDTLSYFAKLAKES